MRNYVYNQVDNPVHIHKIKKTQFPVVSTCQNEAMSRAVVYGVLGFLISFLIALFFMPSAWLQADSTAPVLPLGLLGGVAGALFATYAAKWMNAGGGDRMISFEKSQPGMAATFGAVAGGLLSYQLARSVFDPTLLRPELVVVSIIISIALCGKLSAMLVRRYPATFKFVMLVSFVIVFGFLALDPLLNT